jgi:hypothetical protein
MIAAPISLCAIPKVIWTQDITGTDNILTIHPIVKEALGIERRMQKGIGRNNEHFHYRLCCQRIEAVASPRLLTPFATVEQFNATLEIECFPMSTLSVEYLDVLARLKQKAPAQLRLGATFFPPDMVAKHVVDFLQLARDCGIIDHHDVQKRCVFFKLACEFECGVIEMHEAF